MSIKLHKNAFQTCIKGYQIGTVLYIMYNVLVLPNFFRSDEIS